MKRRIDENIRFRALAVYRSGIPVKLICADYDVSKSQLYEWIKKAGLRKHRNDFFHWDDVRSCVKVA